MSNYRGEDSPLETHYIPLAGKAQPSVLAFFALEQESRVLCYANANLTRAEQPGEVWRFVEFWKELSGSDPTWLYFDSKVTTYPELHRLNQRDIQFVTIRRRGASVVRRLRKLPASSWTKRVIDTPKRCHQNVQYVDERVRLREYVGEVRQVAFTGLGRDQPTLLLTNNEEETARNLLIRYAGRNRVEGGLGDCVNFFHLDCWLGKQLKGFKKASPKQLFRRFVETSGVVEVAADRVVVTLDRRSHNPILRAAALDRNAPAIPWLQGRSILFLYA